MGLSPDQVAPTLKRAAEAEGITIEPLKSVEKHTNGTTTPELDELLNGDVPGSVKRRLEQGDDRSKLHQAMVYECVRHGLGLDRTKEILRVYEPSKKKYGNRIDDETDRSYKKAKAKREEEANAEPAEPTEPSEPTWRWIADLCREVDAAPPPCYLVRPLIVSGDYGVIGAEKKAGKSWLAGDLAVNVAAGGRFLGAYDVEKRGRVLLYAGEGGKRKLVRRLRAIAAFYGLDLDDLPIAVEERAPKLAVVQGVARIETAIAQTGAVLVIIDPAYLALSGAKMSDLVAMGSLLESVQHVCQEAGATLALTHHWNKTGTGTGADRFTGVGFAEWGRFLISGEVKSKNIDNRDGGSVVLLKLDVVGDETADTEVIIRRHVWEERPGDLESPMGYEVEVVANDTPVASDDPAQIGLRPAALRVLKVLEDRAGVWMGKREIGDELANGIPLKERTILDAAKILHERELIEQQDGHGSFAAYAWRVPANGAGNVV